VSLLLQAAHIAINRTGATSAAGTFPRPRKLRARSRCIRYRIPHASRPSYRSRRRVRDKQTLNSPDVAIRAVDPFDPAALSLLREAAIEARQIYADKIDPNAPWPTNVPVPARGVYLLAFVAECPAGCGALYPLDAATAEIRRMYVVRRLRRSGIAQRILQALETAAAEFGYATLRLETGIRQPAAMQLYERAGFHRIATFGMHGTDPLSVCYEKEVWGAGPGR
jgi:putative acetyltransferase